MNKILGLDLGTNSVGWALIDKAENKILGMGSRIIPMGADKQDYEKGIGITKNAERRTARSIRKMNKRYKQRRNKLLFILNELGMLPDQFQFKTGMPEAKKLDDLALLPIAKGTVQLNSLEHYKLRAKATKEKIELKELGTIIYQFNQLRGYAGGTNIEESNKKKNEQEDQNEKKKAYQVITQKVSILKIEKSEKTLKAKGGKNKGQEIALFDITFLLDDEEKEGSTLLQTLEVGKEEELEIRIKQTKAGENIFLALPQKTNWKKQMEATEETLEKEKLFVGELLLRDLEINRWGKIRNRVILRNRYKDEFDAIWEEQAKHYTFLKNCSLNTLEKIAWYLFPGNGQLEYSQQSKLRKEAIEKGLKHILKEQVIYYQRPLKAQTELISNCQFEKNEKVVPITHPQFQQFRSWKQINQLFITAKEEVYNEKKKKSQYKYQNRYLSDEQKMELFLKLQSQKQVGFTEVAKIAGIKNDKTEYLNGLNVKAKLRGCDTEISIKKIIKEIAGDQALQAFTENDQSIITKIWQALYYNTGNEYDTASLKVSSVSLLFQKLTPKEKADEIALKLSQSIHLPRKYASLSLKAIVKVLPLMKPGSVDVSADILENYNKILHTINTGELVDGIEPYMVDYINDNPEILKTGGMMEAFAISLIYGKHTIKHDKPTIKNYHEIKYNPNRNLRNPVVEQVTNETLQVIKALWKAHNLNPDELEIRIELSRDLKNSAAEREKIYKAQLNNQKQNARIKDILFENKIAATDENVLKYKLYEQQKFISPYSGNTLELNLFDTYEIDHIIPKSRLFDDSISNKVLVEGFLNKEKDNRTAWEYITHQVTKHKLFSVESFINHINEHFYGRKKKNLLLEKIPLDMVKRQIKETQYISIAVKSELSKIVDSEKIKTSAGEITSFLRSKWGLKDMFMKMTEERFKQMELWDNSVKWLISYYDHVTGKNVYQIKNWSKRYDHRHHAIDALTVALTEQSHIQRLNNLNKELQNWIEAHKDDIQLEVKEDETAIEAFFNLDEKKRIEVQKQINGFRKIDSPIHDVVRQAQALLESMIVSHKPKDNIVIQFNEKSKKKELKIRSALHEATFYGKHNGQDTKTMDLSNLTSKDIEKIVDRKKKPEDKDCLKEEIEKHKKLFDTIKEAFTGEGLKAFNAKRMAGKKQPVYKVKVYYNTKEVKESALQRLYNDNDKLSVKTGGNYLFLVMEKTNKKTERKERIYDIVSLYDAADIAKSELKNGNENFKRKIYEDYVSLNAADRILFSLQQNELVYLPENEDDIVLNLTNSEFAAWISIPSNKAKFARRVYKVVKFTGKDCFFIPHNYANTISVVKDLTPEQKADLKTKYGEKKIPKRELNFEEFGSFGNCAKSEVNKHFINYLLNAEYEEEPLKIQEHCIKLKIDWMGNIQKAQ